MNSVVDQRARFNELMRRHVREEDKALTDDGFVRMVIYRYEQARSDYLIDPNE